MRLTVRFQTKVMTVMLLHSQDICWWLSCFEDHISGHRPRHAEAETGEGLWQQVLVVASLDELTDRNQLELNMLWLCVRVQHAVEPYKLPDRVPAR